VQQDIDNRRLARINSKAEMQAKAERERLADYFVTYQNINKEVLQAASEQKYPGNSSEPDGTGDLKEIHKLQDEDGNK
jgi:hypothetical protein